MTAFRLPHGWRRLSRFFVSRYFGATLDHPLATLALIALLVATLGAFAGRFRLDASADSLVLENNTALKYYRSIRARYGSDDFLVVTYAPEGNLFAAPALQRIKSLRDELAQLDRVASLTTLLDVPLLRSPPLTFSELRENAHTLLSPGTDIELARKEFTHSPLYKNVLVGEDGDTAGLYVYLKRDDRYQELLNERNALRERELQRDLNAAERAKLVKISNQFKEHSAQLGEQLRQEITKIRGILDKYRDHAEIHLAGVPMIVADMIRFIRHDLRVFGAGVLCFMVALLAVAFRRPRWVLIPVLICAASAIAMIGGLGLINHPVTVVSSNFLSVLLIVTLSLTIHLIVRHEELRRQRPGAGPHELLSQTVRDKFVPCLYTALTTIVAFGSLTVSGIRPVIDFGWMMVVGIVVSFALVFLLFPAVLVLLPAATPVERRYDITAGVTRFFSRLVDHRAAATLGAAALIFAASVAGITRLSVENRFIDYFDSSTEIYQGMMTVDRKLGGTTPLDVIIDADPQYLESARHEHATGGGAGDGGPLSGRNAGLSGSSYWYNAFRLDEVKQVHDYLDGLPGVGKVLSLATSIKLMEQLNGGRPLGNFMLSIAYKRLPDDIKQRLFHPYLSADGNQLRFAARIFESNRNLKLGDLLHKIRTGLVQRFHFAPEQIHLTGMAVLYNNMLQSLFHSQILTFGFVFAVLFLMFLALFRSVRLSAIALAPNLLVAAMVLGLMGWLGIPLDMMTLTIAAIALGIAVDDTIHYIHRFESEFAADRDYWATVKRCHGSIGRAIFYTSITITLGFSILALSDFVPTIYFGMLAGAAMMAALIADLTVLPVLLAAVKPFGREGNA